MPGSGRSDSSIGRVVGVVVALVAVIGAVALGWSFEAPGGSLPTMLGVVAAAVAVGWTLYDRVTSD